MSTIYLSCTLDFDDPGGDDPIGGFGFTELPPDEYPAPVEGSYARVTYDSSAATAGVPFTDSDVTGGYELSGYSYAGSTVFTAESGPVFGVYTYGATVLLRIFPPPGLGGVVRAFVKVETAAASGIEYVVGGGAGYVMYHRSADVPYLTVSTLFDTSEENNVTLTAHFVGSGPVDPPAPFWTDFVGTHEIV